MKWLSVFIISAVIGAFFVGIFIGQRLKRPTDIINTMPTPVVESTIPPSGPFPSQVFDLSNWKLTLPIGEPGHPREIKQPALATYKIDPWYTLSEDGKGIRFRAPVNGVTTSGSSYPRSELREMINNDGKTKASWSSTTGLHTMFLDQAITAVPEKKQHVVAGQIHDADDDIIVIRLEYPNLYVNVGGDNVYTLDTKYTLGKRFTIKFEVGNRQTKVYYNGGVRPVYTLTKDYADSYFKTGAYTQSNCTREISPALCTDSNYGEVVVYQAQVTHEEVLKSPTP